MVQIKNISKLMNYFEKQTYLTKILLNSKTYFDKINQLSNKLDFFF